jgi:hypothetical protein
MFIPQVIYAYGEPRWNDIDRKIKELGEKPVHHKKGKSGLHLILTKV